MERSVAFVISSDDRTSVKTKDLAFEIFVSSRPILNPSLSPSKWFSVATSHIMNKFIKLYLIQVEVNTNHYNLNNDFKKTIIQDNMYSS